MKLGHITLLTVTCSGLALGGYAKPKRIDAQAFKFDLPPVPIAFPAIAPLAVAVRPLPAGGICGGSQSLPVMFMCGGLILPSYPHRESMLSDPVSVMGSAYLKCRLIKAALLDPEVPVEFYPPGHFGRWVQDGVLVTDRVVISDETELQRIFTLLVETAGEPDDLLDYSVEAPAAEMSVGDFRRETRFVPEMTVEFVGEVPLRVEVCTAQKQMLVQIGERWEVFVLDRWGARALRDFLWEKSAEETIEGLHY